MANPITIHPGNVYISRTLIESSLWAIERHLMGKYGCDTAASDMEPLKWYISTGRASGYFLHNLLFCRPYMIARKLHEGGSYDQVLERIKQYMSHTSGYDEEG